MQCGNTSGRDLDKFCAFGLTAAPASAVDPPHVGECFAHLECRVADTRAVNRYGMFVLEVVAAWIDPRRRTIHARCTIAAGAPSCSPAKPSGWHRGCADASRPRADGICGMDATFAGSARGATGPRPWRDRTSAIEAKRPRRRVIADIRVAARGLLFRPPIRGTGATGRRDGPGAGAG
ncbi:MAG TPA: flavin reductase [Burkholderiaceae bacterium]